MKKQIPKNEHLLIKIEPQDIYTFELKGILPVSIEADFNFGPTHDWEQTQYHKFQVHKNVALECYEDEITNSFKNVVVNINVTTVLTQHVWTRLEEQFGSVTPYEEGTLPVNMQWFDKGITQEMATNTLEKIIEELATTCRVIAEERGWIK